MRIRKLLAAVLAAAMLAGLLPAASAANLNPEPITQKGITLGKQATEFSGWDTNVTLDVVANTNQNPIAVQFVLDATKSLFLTEGNQTYVEQWAETLQNLMADKNIYAGLTIFTDTATTVLEPAPVYSIQPLDGADLMEQCAAAALAGKGTNVQAGIREGLNALKGLSTDNVAADKRYLVLITDGGSFYWLNGDEAVNNSYYTGDERVSASMENSDAADTNHLSTSDLNALLERNLDAHPRTYGDPSAAEPLAAAVEEVTDTGIPTNFETGIYFAAKELQNVTEQGVKLVTVGYPYYPDDASVSALSDLAGQFIDYAQSLSMENGRFDATLENTQAQLDTILSSIYGQTINVAVPAGSVITDYLGYARTPEAYNFDLLKDEFIRVSLSNANGTSEGGLYSESQALGSSGSITFQRNGADFLTVDYTDADDATEKLVITLHQDLLRGQKLSITYAARLVEYVYTVGVHTVYPNVEAYLTPANTTDRLAFPQPSLTFSRGGGGGGGGGTDITDPEVPLGPGPELNMDDHFAYIIGRDDGKVHPLSNITRAEVATIFFRMLTDNSRSMLWSSSCSYLDMEREDWFNNAVSTLTNGSIITGKPGNVFDPDSSITRAEFATIAVRFFGGTYEGDDLFPDIAGHWANQYINRAAVLGLINGRGDGTFDPDASITRAEAMAIVNRTLGRKPVADHMLPNMITWPDNLDTKTWYYADVQEATNSHDFEAITVNDEQVESWTVLLPVRDWAALEQEWSNANSSVNPGDVLPDITPDTAE